MSSLSQSSISEVEFTTVHQLRAGAKMETSLTSEIVVVVVVVVLLLYVPSQQLWSLRDGQFT